MEKDLCFSRFIINADDLGVNTSINTAIFRSFENRWISSTTIMANMPGFSEACHYAHDLDLIDKIGIHFVLTEGVPLSDAIRRQKRFCDNNGCFLPRSGHKRYIKLNSDEKTAIAAEFAAQVEKCRKNRLPLTHLDSHHHLHEEWGIMGIIFHLAKDYNIPHVRIMRNMNATGSFQRKIYTAIFNARLRQFGLAHTQYFGSIYNYIEFSCRYPSAISKSTYEIMVHPGLCNNGTVIDREKGERMEQLIVAANLLDHHNVTERGYNNS